MFLRVVSMVIIFLAPLTAAAGLSVSEVAWMGTATSTSDEWIELRNDGAGVVELSGWSISWSDRIVVLTGAIPGNGYFLLERTDDNTVPNVVADQIYTGALNNTEVNLYLKQGDTVVQTISASPDWPAGDSVTKQTMQWDGGRWVTATATPRAAYVPSSDETEQDDSSTTGAPVSWPALSTATVTETNITQSLSVRAGKERIGYRGIPVEFESKAMNAKTSKCDGITYEWSFGDGGSGRGVKLVHVYRRVGEYVVVLRAACAGESATDRTSVKVVQPEVEITQAVIDGTSSYVTLANNAKYELNIGGWIIEADRSTFSFPQDTIIKPKSQISIDSEISSLSFTQGSRLVLKHSGGRQFSTAIAGDDPDKVRTLIARRDELAALIETVRKRQAVSTSSLRVVRATVPSVSVAPTSTVSVVSSTSSMPVTIIKKPKRSFFGLFSF